LRLAYRLGVELLALKEEIGHGKWLLWLCANFKELGKNEYKIRHNAERCMSFASRNPNCADSTQFGSMFRLNEIGDGTH
jgi:hypothetical protein